MAGLVFVTGIRIFIQHGLLSNYPMISMTIILLELCDTLATLLFAKPKGILYNIHYERHRLSIGPSFIIPHT